MKKLFLILFLVGCVFAGSAFAAYAAPRLYFSPATSDQTVGETFKVVVKIDTGEKEAMASDAVISFDSTKLKVNQVTSGGFFTGFDYNLEDSNGQLTIYTFSEQTLKTNSGKGDLATITFEAEANGEATVSFLCEEGNDTDSAIWDSSGNDLIDCASNGSGTYTIGGVGGATSSSTPTPTATGSATATPSELPETGVETPLIIMGLGGIIVLLLSTVMVI
jgi:hypothetical protein